ncbi:LPD1 domain-containing protein [Fibrella sp. WM1]|uniref:LPD1 domain-containing protein n=1 Tax=Fibrella musci TaxID=3242485 RepID=UPI00352279EB
MKRRTPIAKLNPAEQRLGFTPSYNSAKFAVDTDTRVSIGSRLDKYYKQNGFVPLYKGFSRTNREITPADINAALERYKLKGIEFGRWVTNEDAYNYLAALVVALDDFAKIVGWTNIGLDRIIGIAFGARGMGRALAHFEPGTYMINLTRYKRHLTDPFTGQVVKTAKTKRFSYTGGVGSLAHEYGHALDYFFGAYIDQNTKAMALSGGRFTALIENNPWKNGSLRWQMINVLKAYQQTGSYKKLREYLGSKGEYDSYWLRHNELWARLFEQWIGLRMSEKGIDNDFLHQSKYEALANSKAPVYLTSAELKGIAPAVSLLIKSIAAEIKK